ncbi:unnamed protein product [marine sediment metagenome]|uniref:Cardiolipin synthase N-terminal domain-containing protein n=1 Tax=marine sediment metagenome TaxID=412755 RepID=X1IDH0_9ZZZZ
METTMAGDGALEALLFEPVILLVLLLYLGSIVWVAIDAVKRDRSGCLIGFLVMGTWPVGLFIWLLARPEKAD